jgi:hypothetical protein
VSARVVYAVAAYRELPQGPLTVLDDQDHHADGIGHHVLRVRTAAWRECYLLASDVTDQPSTAVTA